ncbi:uncharacterized protein TM35_000016750 [Trypanosoma theileri]|uniref:Uncharacterized protein n=1 Tax=Trypanosoma theileri TaxID=67003 RepID=A0A1X0PA82_9TRYP|nr:uncharacterized protein TM35_000016750 [Trypanosoma theileri]ORC93798.1 hypothetical protein TM35_000016750 [Trypanosoma theileri]
MGHHGEALPVYNHREALLVQRRLMTFLLVFSVFAVAFVLLIASVQTRQVDCQARAHAAVRVVFAHPAAADGTIAAELVAALRQRGVQAVPTDGPPAPPDGHQLNALDTTAHTLAAAGFRLLRTITGAEVLWQLRNIDSALCGSQRTISMEALPNVDYERVSYHVKAVMANGARTFLYEASVITKDKERITTFPQLQSLFPGFNVLVAPPRMLETKPIHYFTNFSADLYYDSIPMDVELRVEEWKQPNGKTMYWRIVISSSNILAERNLKEVYSILFGTVQEKGFMCSKEECGDSYDNVFLQ